MNTEEKRAWADEEAVEAYMREMSAKGMTEAERALALLKRDLKLQYSATIEAVGGLNLLLGEDQRMERVTEVTLVYLTFFAAITAALIQPTPSPMKTYDDLFAPTLRKSVQHMLKGLGE